MTEIIKGLYLGNRDTPVCDQNYSLIINCTPDLPLHPEECRQIRIPVWDRPESAQYTVMQNCLPTVVRAIDDALQRQQKVLVYCAEGQSRSPTVIACYLLWINRDWTADQSIKSVKDRDSNAFFGGVTFQKVIEWAVMHFNVTLIK